MLARLSPADLVGIRAARAVVPLEDGWLQAGTVAATVHNEQERYFAMKAGQRLVSPSRLREPREYIPRRRDDRQPVVKVDQASIDAHQRMFEQRQQPAAASP